jgi:hypothetical protein
MDKIEQSGGGYTRGPWVAYCQDVTGERALGDDGVRFWDISGAGPYRGGVASVHAALNIGGITLEERDANARLIAAAPELVEALRGLVSIQDIMDDEGVCDGDYVEPRIEAARALLARINGDQV